MLLNPCISTHGQWLYVRLIWSTWNSGQCCLTYDFIRFISGTWLSQHFGRKCEDRTSIQTVLWSDNSQRQHWCSVRQASPSNRSTQHRSAVGARDLGILKPGPQWVPVTLVYWNQPPPPRYEPTISHTRVLGMSHIWGIKMLNEVLFLRRMGFRFEDCYCIAGSFNKNYWLLICRDCLQFWF